MSRPRSVELPEELVRAIDQMNIHGYMA
jgi:hypothetical protein